MKNPRALSSLSPEQSQCSNDRGRVSLKWLHFCPMIVTRTLMVPIYNIPLTNVLLYKISNTQQSWKNFSKHPYILTIFFFLGFYLFIFRQRGRERGREGKKHQCVVASHAPPTGDLGRNSGTCPDWKSNQRPLGSQARTQSTKPHQPRLYSPSFSTLKFLITNTSIHPVTNSSYFFRHFQVFCRDQYADCPPNTSA